MVLRPARTGAPWGFSTVVYLLVLALVPSSLITLTQPTAAQESASGPVALFSRADVAGLRSKTTSAPASGW